MSPDNLEGATGEVRLNPIEGCAIDPHCCQGGQVDGVVTTVEELYKNQDRGEGGCSCGMK